MSEPVRICVTTTSRTYDVLVGAGLLDELGRHLAAVLCPDVAFVVTDTNVGPLYLERACTSLREAGLKVASVTIPAGESHKNLSTYGSILSAMAEARLTRSSLVVALGGGVVGDMAGFAAATYMRGIPVVQVPTTLLSMVDSSVGGKTAIDLSVGKNLVGAFLQPSLVVADVQTLSTLDPYVFADGMGEVVKHAVLADPTLFTSLEERPVTQDADETYLCEVVANNIAIKRDVVATDEQERGLRQTLNLGHTIGHAIEAAGSYREGHGHCVAMGLCHIARAAERKGWAEPGLAQRVECCVALQGLPIATDITPAEILGQAAHDKKRHGETINVVVPTHIGAVEMRTIDFEQFGELVELGRRPMQSEA